MTSTCKEGPPTLRECSDMARAMIMCETKCPNCYESKGKEHGRRCVLERLSRLTDEALAIDEMRGTALEELYRAVNALPVRKGNIPFEDLGPIHKALDKLDVLTPDKEGSK